MRIVLSHPQLSWVGLLILGLFLTGEACQAETRVRVREKENASWRRAGPSFHSRAAEIYEGSGLGRFEKGIYLDNERREIVFSESWVKETAGSGGFIRMDGRSYRVSQLASDPAFRDRALKALVAREAFISREELPNVVDSKTEREKRVEAAVKRVDKLGPEPPRGAEREVAATLVAGEEVVNKKVQQREAALREAKQAAEARRAEEHDPTEAFSHATESRPVDTASDPKVIAANNEVTRAQALSSYAERYVVYAIENKIPPAEMKSDLETLRRVQETGDEESSPDKMLKLSLTTLELERKEILAELRSAPDAREVAIETEQLADRQWKRIAPRLGYGISDKERKEFCRLGKAKPPGERCNFVLAAVCR